MVTKLSAANQRHILSNYKGSGGLTGFVEDIDYLKKGHGLTPERAIKRLIDGGTFLVYYTDVAKYLNRVGVKYKSNEDAWSKYNTMLSKDGAALYREYKKKHPDKR